MGMAHGMRLKRMGQWKLLVAR